MTPIQVNCPQCGKASLVLWCFDQKAVCDACLLLYVPAKDTSNYKLCFSPQQNAERSWVQANTPDFAFLRQFVEAFLRPEKHPELRPLLTKTPRSIDSVLKTMESMVPQGPNVSNDPALARRLEDIDLDLKHTAAAISKEREMLSVVRRSDKQAQHARLLKDLEKRLDALEEEKSSTLRGEHAELAEIRNHAISRLNRDFTLWNKGLLEPELAMPVHRVYWELLKPSGSSWDELIRYFRYLQNSRNEEYDLDRLKPLYDLKPDKIYVGRVSFEGYVVFCYSRGETAALECPRVGNALYLMKLDEWKFLSQQSKTELLFRHPEHVERVVHTGDYKYEIKRRLRNRGIEQPDATPDH